MKIYPTFRYQMRDQRTAVLVYYGVMASMVLLSLIAMPVISGKGIFVSTNGVTAVTSVFAFILSLCSFKESFLMNLQHGVSRNSQFLGRLAAMGAVCAIMAAADEGYTLLTAALQAIFPDSFQGSSLYEMVYAGEASPISPLLSIVFSFFLLLAACSLGYLLTVFTYRLNKMGKLLFWAGVPALTIVFFSYLEANFTLYGQILAFIVNVGRLCFASLPRMALTCTLAAAIFSTLTWLLMRRAVVK